MREGERAFGWLTGVEAGEEDSLNTPRTVSGFGRMRVACLPRDDSATTPRSPSLRVAALTSADVRPVAADTALIRMESPMPSSRPTYAGAKRLQHKYTAHIKSSGERAMMERKRLHSTCKHGTRHLAHEIAPIKNTKTLQPAHNTQNDSYRLHLEPGRDSLDLFENTTEGGVWYWLPDRP